MQTGRIIYWCLVPFLVLAWVLIGGIVRILIDTNILIYRENHHIISEALRDLLNKVNTLGFSAIIHPASVQDIKRDPDVGRGRITL